MTQIGSQIGKYIRKEKDDFDDISNKQSYSDKLMGLTMDRIQSLLNSKQGSNVCYLMILIFLVFFVLYFLWKPYYLTDLLILSL